MIRSAPLLACLLLVACNGATTTSVLRPDVADPVNGEPPRQEGARRDGATPTFGEPPRATSQLSQERAKEIRDQLAADAARAPRGSADDAATAAARAEALRAEARRSVAPDPEAAAVAQREADALRREAQEERQRRLREIAGD